MMRFRQMPCFRSTQTAAVTLLVAAAFIIGTFYVLTSDSPPVPLILPLSQSCKHLAAKLDNVLQELQMAHSEGLPPSANSLKTIRQILTSMEPEVYRNGVAKEENSDVQQPLSVCPEVYANGTFGIPYYENEKGWVTLPCSAPPLEKVVSIVLSPLTQKNCTKHLDWVLKGINKHYPSISVYIATNSNCEAVLAKSFPNIHLVPIPSSTSPGLMWMTLLAKVKTPYVLVARDIFHFTNFSRVERQVRIVSSNSRIAVAGGTTRNESGHWNIGCFQTRLSNFILEYTEGYYLSKNECMFCDYVSGPFVARTSIFKQFPLHPKLSQEMLFHDFFLELKNASYNVLNCPDTMHFARNVDQIVQKSRDVWIPLARKWELNRILLPKSVKHEISCDESEVTCNRATAKSYLIPICCRKKYLGYLKTLVNTGLRYELRDGDVLAAVKMRGSIPWDTDTDLNVMTSGRKPWEKIKETLNTIKFKSVDYDEWLSVRVPNTNINMDPIQNLSSSVFLPEELEGLPTLVEYDGEWLVGPVSPGLYARNEYGVEILRHVQSYSIYGGSDPYQLYKPGVFLPCPKPHHHACLDHFATDGNIQFLVP